MQAINFDIATNKSELLEAVEDRVPAEWVFNLADKTGVKKDMLAQWLEISLKTLKRYQQENKKLNAKESELVLKLYGLFGRGETVFGSFGEFRLWLKEPAYGLNGQIPEELLYTSEGVNMVNEELDRIAYGDLA